MGKLRVSTREIGNVCVFDLEGTPTQEGLQEVAWKIQRNIRRHRMQRVILNLQRLATLDPLGLRKLLAACLRPQCSLIYGASDLVIQTLENTYMPHNVRICHNDREVAEDFGPFLLEHDKEKEFAPRQDGCMIGKEVERRRSKRMHVALPIELTFHLLDGTKRSTNAISTNISEGGLFAEYLDLETAQKLEDVKQIEGLEVEIHIFPNANFPEEYHVRGKVVRTDLKKKQFGVGVEFVDK